MRNVTLCIAVALVSVLAQAEIPSLLQNGDFELWTAGLPNNWAKGTNDVLTQSSLLNGSSSVQLTAITGNSNNNYFRQTLSTPIAATSPFYLAFDIAFQNASTGRDWNLNLTAGGTSSAFNMYYRTNTLYIYNGTAWVTIDASGVMTASNFGGGVIRPYRIIIEGVWLGSYDLKVINLATDTVVLHKTGLNHFQAQLNATVANFDLSRGPNQILVDNVRLYPQNPFQPVVEAGLNTTIELPASTLVMAPAVTNTSTPVGNLIVQWTQVSGPAMTFSAAAGETEHDLNAKVNFVGGRGEYVLKLTVTDSSGLTGQDTINVRVKNAAIEDVLLGRWGFEDMPQSLTAADMLDAAAGNVVADNGFLAGLDGPNSLPRWVPGWVGGAALEFAGNGIVDVNDVALQDPNMKALRWEMTVAGWVKADPLSGGYRTLMGRVSPFNWALRKSLNTNQAEFVMQMDNTQVWLTGTTSILDGYWHHLAGTFDGRQAVLYVDGIEDASAETQALIRRTPESVITIGGRRDASHFLNGMADDVRLYSYALTPSEIASLVQLGVNAIPRVAINADIPTELIKQFNNTVQLGAVIVDSNPGDVMTTVWSVPNAELAPFVSFSDENALAPTASFSHAGVFTLRLTVNDGLAGLDGDIYDEIVITVNEPVCDDLLVYNEATGRFLNPYLSADISGAAGKPDCYINLYDLSELASDWLLCNDPEGDGCIMPQ